MIASSATANFFKLGPKTFDYITDVEWFDGPWASLFLERKSKEIYYLTWADRSESFHRWLFFPVSPRSFRLFLNGKLSDEDLLWLNHADPIFLLELNGDMAVGEVQEILKSEIPADFRPSPEGFFEPNLCPDLEKIEQFLRQFSPAVERKTSLPPLEILESVAA